MKRSVVLVVLSLALLLGAPLAWWSSQPSDSAGLPIDQALPAPTSPVPAGPESEARDSNATAPLAGVTVATRPAAVPAPAEVASPRRLRIESVAVDATVDPVGVEDDGSMVIPREAARVGWYRFGSAPGSAEGAAVIAGHVDSRTQGKGALFQLREVAIGDIIEVDNSDGTGLRYQVISMDRIVKEALPTERLFTREGPPRLVLITCGGPFNEALRSYEDNLVVVAEPLM